MSIKKNNRGFTIVELMISISVFSIVLLICISAIIYIGRLYYLGITGAKTQEVARSTLDTIGESVKFSSEKVQTNIAPVGDWRAFCIGSTKYSYKLDKVLLDSPDTSKNQTDQALIENIDPACGTNSVIASPVINNPTTSVPNKELLGKFMRVNDFSINVVSVSPQSSLVTINLSVVYGGDGTDEDDMTLFDIDQNGKIVACKSGVGGSQFCSVRNLTVTVNGV